ncbi:MULTISPECIES: hypothetical protein [Kamptonema]|uniref:hypothetical protein n=1 Tax=Kamptonema TaxID=1501433 RepID=UPI0001DAC8FF|nr:MULTISPECIES: hypothetical protein [Kamptonema]CBN53849.1 exported hypothetical protein [Kamptonema sp. PCC 6506]
MNKKFKFRFLVIALFLCLASGGFLADRYLKRPFALPLSTKYQSWPVKVGLRIATLRDRIPTVDRVVLVPDEATFLTAIQQWSLQGRWPILIEDPKYTPMFIERFQPAELIRLPSVKQPLPKGKQLEDSIIRALATAWNATDIPSLKDTWLQLGWQPPGVVISSINDPAWPAAVALAADRGQPLVFVEGNFGQPNDTLNLDRWQSLQKIVDKAAETTGYAYANLGDAIDTITLVRQLAVKYQSPKKADEQLAVTDGLARYPNGSRWAIVGWIYGSSFRSVYQAMSSIFLDFKTAMLYDSYQPEGNWEKYEIEAPTKQLNRMDFSVEHIQQPKSSLETWKNLVSHEWDFDLIFINSKGNKDKFFVGGGDASVNDIPKLKSPAVIHLIHSWSATSPDDRNTVAGRWLENGVYAYVGSVHEPYLAAFLPPKIIVERLSASVPFLIATRLLESAPWKITTIGDPLMILSKPREKISPNQQPIPK